MNGPRTDDERPLWDWADELAWETEQKALEDGRDIMAETQARIDDFFEELEHGDD